MRRSYVWDPITGNLVEKQNSAPNSLHYIQPDLPDYQSPIDGKVVSGRRQRRYDLERSGSRPYEGRATEVREALRIKAQKEQAMDQLAERMAHKAWADAPERVRKVFRSR
jgi:hypothetical protein